MTTNTTAAALNPTIIARGLRERLQQLRGEIRDTLLRADAERYADIAGQLGESQDLSLADLLADVSHAEVARDVEEIRDIEAAIARLASGSYGTCITCARAIPAERLRAYATAKRCLPCEQRHEATRRQGQGSPVAS